MCLEYYTTTSPFSAKILLTVRMFYQAFFPSPGQLSFFRRFDGKKVMWQKFFFYELNFFFVLGLATNSGSFLMVLSKYWQRIYVYVRWIFYRFSTVTMVYDDVTGMVRVTLVCWVIRKAAAIHVRLSVYVPYQFPPQPLISHCHSVQKTLFALNIYNL